MTSKEIQLEYVKYVKTKDENTFNKMYLHIERYLNNYHNKYYRNIALDVREEILLDTLSKIVTTAPTMYDETKSNITTWLTQCMLNDLWMYARKKTMLSSIESMIDEFGNTYDPPDVSEEYDHTKDFDMDIVNKAIEELPSCYKDTFKLYAQGNKYEQIASMTNTPINTVRTRIFSSKRIVKDKYYNLIKQHNGQTT